MICSAQSDGETKMEVRYRVFIDGGQTPSAHAFSATPRIGEWITISEDGEPVSLIVEQVEHIADAAFSNEPAAVALVHAKRRKI
jgi:hypothetical protein